MPNTYLDSLGAEWTLASQASQQASLVRPHFTTTTLTASEVAAAMRKVGEKPKELWMVTRTYQPGEVPQFIISKYGHRTKQLALASAIANTKRETKDNLVRINDCKDEIELNQDYLAKLELLASELAKL